MGAMFSKKTQFVFMQFPNDVKNYFQLCTMIGLKQLIVPPT